MDLSWLWVLSVSVALVYQVYLVEVQIYSDNLSQNSAICHELDS